MTKKDLIGVWGILSSEHDINTPTRITVHQTIDGYEAIMTSPHVDGGMVKCLNKTLEGKVVFDFGSCCTINSGRFKVHLEHVDDEFFIVGKLDQDFELSWSEVLERID